jgi:xylan 1,4-beta-xylosidase
LAGGTAALFIVALLLPPSALPLVSAQVDTSHPIRIHSVGLSSSSEKSIEVNYSETNGRIRSLQGVNGGPYSFGWPPILEQYRQIGVDYVRTHDVPRAFDIDAVFPHMDADPSEESSYDFRLTDPQVQAILSIHAQVLYRLGYSWGGPNAVPRDYAKFADICRHIVMHYNDAWANGFHYGIQYWEIWNEPDIKQFWLGTPQEYFRLYDTVARALKTVDPNIKVGGPALAWDQAFLEEFLRFCNRNKTPLDFVSWHTYPGEIRDAPPYSVAETAQQIQRLMWRYGFYNVENFLTEWNYLANADYSPNLSLVPNTSLLWNASGAAWTASVLVYLQDTPLSRAFRYRGNEFWGSPFGLFLSSGGFKKTAYAFLAMKKVLQTPVRLACKGSDNAGFAVLAGRSETGGNVTVLISDFHANYSEFELSINGLPWKGKTVIVEIYLLDDTNDLALVGGSEQMLSGSGSLVIRHRISPSSLYLISLQAKEPSSVSTTSSEITPQTSLVQSVSTTPSEITPQTSVGQIGQSPFTLAAVALVLVVAVAYLAQKRRSRP